MDSMVPCYSLLNMKVVWLYMVSASPPITMEERESEEDDLMWKFAKILWKSSMGGIENKWGSNIYCYIITLSLSHFFKNSQHQKTEVFLLRISLEIHNASVVTCRYPQIYNFSFRKEFLETLCKCILTTSSATPFLKNIPTSWVFSL